MKLIDLLKQELPKWESKYNFAAQDKDGVIDFYEHRPVIDNRGRAWVDRITDYDGKSRTRAETAEDWNTTIVTREQYEAVVTQWIPEVGTECEMKHLKIDQWIPVKVTGVGEEGVILRLPSTAHEHYFRFEGRQFRPIRTERDKAIEAMLDLLNAGTQLSLADAIEQLYDAGYRKV